VYAPTRSGHTIASARKELTASPTTSKVAVSIITSTKVTIISTNAPWSRTGCTHRHSGIYLTLIYLHQMFCRQRWLRWRQGCPAAIPSAATCACRTRSALGPPAATGRGSTAAASPREQQRQPPGRPHLRCATLQCASSIITAAPTSLPTSITQQWFTMISPPSW
jgi:hypothetical protein